MRIQVTPAISIDEDELQEEFTLASGPGGQNVNKVSTAVRLRFGVNSPSISDAVQDRLKSVAKGRVNEGGELVIEARRFRTQAANRRDALNRLVELIREAAREPKIHRKTRPTLGSRDRRLKAKHHRAGIKQSRKMVTEESEG